MQKKLVILFVTFIIFAFLTLISSVSSYITPSQVKSLGNAIDVKVIGIVEDVKFHENKTVFYLSDGKDKIKVLYNGLLSSDIEEVVVVGDWDGFNFYAKQILTKCHTKYGSR